MKKYLYMFVLFMGSSINASDAPSIVVSNFYSALEFGTNNAFMAYVAPSSDGKESGFIKGAREVLRPQFEKHQFGFDIIGEQTATGFAIVVGDLYFRAKPMGGPGILYLVNINSNWFLLPFATQYQADSNTNYTYGNLDLLYDLEGVGYALKNKGDIFEAERRNKLVK